MTPLIILLLSANLLALSLSNSDDLRDAPGIRLLSGLVALIDIGVLFYVALGVP